MTGTLSVTSCHGNNDTHCCWLNGEVCQYLEENTVPGRRWACGLLRRAGSWDNVYRSAAYQSNVKPRLIADNVGTDCGGWPQAFMDVLMLNGNGVCCFEGVNRGDVDSLVHR